MVSSILAHLDKLTTPQGPAAQGELTYWRERVLLCCLLIAVVVGFFAYIAGLSHFIREGMWGIVVIDTAAYGIALLMFLCRQIPFFIRAGVSLLIIYMLGIYLLYAFGFYADGFIWLFAFPVMACILLGLRAAMAALIISAVSMAVVDYLVVTKQIVWFFPAVDLSERMLSLGTDFMLLCIMVTASLGIIVNRLQSSLESGKSMQKKLEAEISERKHLESALRESEKKYRMYFESVSDVIYSLDTELNVINVSPSVSRVLGYAPEKLVGLPFTDSKVVAKEYMNSAVSDLRKALSGHPIHNVYEFITRQGNRIMGDVHGAPLVEDGKIVGVVNVGRDITEIRRAREALEYSQDRFRETLELLPSIVLEMDLDMRITYINTLGLSTFGHASKNPDFGINVLDVVHPDDAHTFQRTFKRLKNQEKNYPSVIRFFSGEGAEIRMLVHSSLIHQGKKITGFRVCLNDITAQKKMEEELQKVQKLESVGVLAGGIAHDFNNLLVSILGNISLAIHHTGEDDDRYQLLKDAESASLNAKALTQQLLTFSKGGEPVKELSAIDDVIRDSADFILRGSHTRCRYHFAEHLYPLEIDKGQISQVIQNIVINASQSMSEGGTIDIDVDNCQPDNKQQSFLPAERYIRIMIKDTGPGIPADIIDRIFDPYFTTRSEGNGLGLAVTHAIILKHDGHISVSSRPGEGTVFTIYLPASKEIPSLKVQNSDSANLRTGGKIMIMDDEQMVRDVVQRMLSRAGYEVLCVRDGQEAILQYQKEPVDAIIMDLTIPGAMGGQEAVQKIKQIDPDAKVIVSSGYSNDPVMANFAEYGFCAAIEKPYQFTSLIDIVGRVVAERRLPTA